ncbi:MAG TPA: peptidylprolyl isomerase [Candidatus Sulfotelmatobacter sp.]
MKRLCLILIASACLPALVAGQTAGQPAGQPSAPKVPAPAAAPAPAVQPSGQTVEEIITRVNNQIITKSEFERSKDQLRDEVKQQNSKDPDKVYAEREKDILRDLVDQQLLLDKGKDLGISGDTELIKDLDKMRKEMKLDSMEDLEKEAVKQGISWEDFKQNKRNQIITQKVIGEEVSSHLSVSKEEIQKFYDDHKAEMEQPEYIRLSEILVAPKIAAPAPAAAPATTPGATDSGAPAAATPNAAPVDDAARQAAEAAALSAAEAKANDLLKQIHDGAAFEDIAKKYSDGPSAADGGNLGTFERGKLAKPIEEKTFALKAGEVTDVIQTKQGYVILKVVEHQQAGIPPLKDALPHIQDALYYEKLQPALRAYLTKLREDAYIKYADGYIDTGMSPNQTQPVETAAAKEADAKKLGKKKHKKLGFL